MEPRPGLTEGVGAGVGVLAAAALDGPGGLEQALLDAENRPWLGPGSRAERSAMRTLLLARRLQPSGYQCLGEQPSSY